MRIFLTLFTVFALLFTLTAELSHAHVLDQDAQTHISAEKENNQDNKLASDRCEIVCNAHHYHIDNDQSNGISLYDPVKNIRTLGKDHVYLPDFVYGLKRPPKA